LGLLLEKTCGIYIETLEICYFFFFSFWEQLGNLKGVQTLGFSNGKVRIADEILRFTNKMAAASVILR